MSMEQSIERLRRVSELYGEIDAYKEMIKVMKKRIKYNESLIVEIINNRNQENE